MSIFSVKPYNNGIRRIFLGITLFIVVLSFCLTSSGVRRRIRRSLPNSELRAGYKPVTDVSKADFKLFSADQDISRQIAVSVPEISDQFTVTAEKAAVDSRAFRIKPDHYFCFISSDIKSIVKNGLSTTALDGTPLEKPFHGTPKIETDNVSRSWRVTIPKVNGEGIISLTIGKSRAEHRLEKPNIFPIWKFIQYAIPPSRDPAGRGIVYVQGCTVLGKDHTKDNDKDCSIIAGNKAQNFCGYRVYGISDKCIWFEIVYFELSRKIKRTVWPDVSSVSRIENGIAAASKISFPDGTEMTSGTYPLSDGESLVCQPDSILDENAFKFSYLNASGEKICDVLCVNYLNFPIQ